jgi:hypothetical protein
MTMDLSRMKEPFSAEHIEWRIQTSGEKNGRIWAKCLAYVTNRAIMDRLDEVAGPAQWRNEYAPAPCGGVMCGISILVDGHWITKWDGAENTDIEGVKGGLSGAMKRAAVQWGIGRYLYDLDEGFADIVDGGTFSAKTKDGKWFKWNPPPLPRWALPGVAAKSDSNDVDRIRQLMTEREITAKQHKQLSDKLHAGIPADEAAKALAFLESQPVHAMNGAA